MTRLLFYSLIIAVAIAGFLLYIRHSTVLTRKKPEKNPSVAKQDKRIPSGTGRSSVSPATVSSKSVFIPSWSQIPTGETFEGYDRVIYFGVPVVRGGLEKQDEAYKNVQDFIAKVPSDRQIWVTVKMINTDTNVEILNDPAGWEVIADDLIEMVKIYGIKGVVLDLEMSALSTDALVKRISDFERKVHEKLSVKDIPLALAIYGDAFYRKRPFDIKILAENSEEIMVMAYDFHKSYGEPGPNFPLGGKELYGYDFKSMIDDFTAQVPVSKLSIMYGMYGYDWVVDEKKRPIKPAKAISLNEIRKNFIQSCTEKNCISRRDDQSAETEVNYIDTNVNYHIIWFEDEKSVERKMKVAAAKGVGRVVYWSYGYY